MKNDSSRITFVTLTVWKKKVMKETLFDHLSTVFFCAVLKAKAEVGILRAEISSPKSHYVQKVSRMEQAMNQLTEELWTNLKSRTGKIHQCKEETGRLREKVESHQKRFVVELSSVLLRIKMHCESKIIIRPKTKILFNSYWKSRNQFIVSTWKNLSALSKNSPFVFHLDLEWHEQNDMIIEL